jgi:hypothetical protein
VSLQAAADFIQRRHDDGRAAFRAVLAARDAEWSRRRGESGTTDAHVIEFVQERIRCLLIPTH